MPKHKNLDLFSIIKNTQINTPVCLDNISAGFPSPATDYMAVSYTHLRAHET